ncbi:MAG: hypothetical protein ACRER2_11955, partial [Methylococcales bacterium]
NPCDVRKKQGHPFPQPCPHGAKVSTQGNLTTVLTGESIFPEPAVDPFTKPPGTNFLPTLYTNIFDGNGNEMLNTLPSTPTNPYNLHDGDPVVSEIDPTSPTDDLRSLFETITRLSLNEKKEAADDETIHKSIQTGIDILEGNPLPNRAYSGLPLLHYTGPEKVKKVEPIYDDKGTLIGGNVNVHQVWYDIHIESDTAFLDPGAVMEVPWTIIYTIDALSRGADDFSPFVAYTDDPDLTHPNLPLPHIGMDQTFFPMEEGTRTVVKVKMTPGKYFNIVYTWGWRMHPPRVQVMENATKEISISNNLVNLVDWERMVFGASPRASEENKLKAIAKISELSPAKRMWTAMREARDAVDQGNYHAVAAKIQEAGDAFEDWRDRTRLPRGVPVDQDSDLTLLYVNNTLYAEFADRAENIADSVRIDFAQWKIRPATLKVTLYNGDHFEHGYENMDFGGARGWENQFKSSVKFAGSGCWFTFGRVNWWPNIPNTMSGVPGGDLSVVLPAAPSSTAALPYPYTTHKLHITFNYEPSRRLRFYQFDPIHHDVAVFSVH